MKKALRDDSIRALSEEEIKVGHAVAFFRAALCLIIVIFHLSGAKSAPAADTLFLRESSSTYRLGAARLDFLVDKTGALSIDDVTSPRFAASFIPSRQDILNFGMTGATFWLRFTVDGRSSAKKKWILVLDHPLMAEVDLYIPRGDGSYEVKSTGYSRPIGTRELGSRDIAFPLQLSSFPETYYLRARIEGRAQFPLTVMNSDAFQRKERFDLAIFSACCGFLGAMAIVGLTLFLYVRERSYLFFCIYIASSLMATAVIKGYYYSWFFTEYTDFHRNSLLVYSILMILTGLLFTRSFLKVAETAPRLDRALFWLVALSILMIPIHPFIHPLYAKISINIIYLAAALFSMAAAVTSYRKGYGPARYFLFSRVVVYVGAFSYALVNFNLLPAIPSGNLMLIFPVLDAGFITLALADRIRMQSSQITALVADLRQEIDERTVAHRVLEEEMSERIRLEREIVRISDNERIKISQELHDGLCQQLTGARLFCSALEGSLTAKGEDLAALAPLKGLLDEAVNHAYDLSRGVWPLEDNPQGHPPSLEELTTRMSRQSGIAVELSLNRSCAECGNQHMAQIYRIAQESILNAVKHSGAKRITVAFECGPEKGIFLDIRDNGMGRRERPRNAAGGMGIRIMAHRARMMGGRVEIQDLKEGGTRVICMVPCLPGPTREVMDVGSEVARS